jgi:negative regulator of sigma-B (phosphoserine phosphatase)
MIEYGVAFRARAGESGCGDVHAVIARRNGVLVAAVDGLGHGKDAAVAASTAGCCLRAHAQEPILALLEHCHQALRSTRGAVMSVASIDASTRSMTWVGVGNVQGVLLRRTSDGAREHGLLLRSGVIGARRLPLLRAEVLRLSAGDTLVFATDGIESDFSRELVLKQPPQRAADSILSQYGKAIDDALVLVVRYVGNPITRRRRSAHLRGRRSHSGGGGRDVAGTARPR